MYTLLSTELEAIARCKAASILPEDAPFPADETACIKIVEEAGILHCEKFAYRDKHGNLKFHRLVSPNEASVKEKKAVFAKNHPDVLTILPISMAEQQTSFSMEAWYLFFSQGQELLDINEFNSRIATGCRRELTIEQIKKGFALKYESPANRCTASRRQLDVLAEMIVSGRLAPIPQREWENLTKARATELISSVPAPKKEKNQSSAKVKNILSLYETLTKDEKNELFEAFKNQLRGE